MAVAALPVLPPPARVESGGGLPHRLLSRLVRAPSGCWEFAGCRSGGGYGQIGTQNGLKLTHRVSYELFCGPIPDGMMVCHACDNRACANPTHLFLGTNRDNMADMTAKGRQAKGERVGAARLGVEQVVAIRRLLRTGRTGKSLARQFGVSMRTVAAIRDNERWRHVAA